MFPLMLLLLHRTLSSTLPVVGRTVAGLCLVYPDSGDGGVFGWQREKLIEELRCAAAGWLSSERLCFVASVLVPVLVRYAGGICVSHS